MPAMSSPVFRGPTFSNHSGIFLGGVDQYGEGYGSSGGMGVMEGVVQGEDVPIFGIAS